MKHIILVKTCSEVQLAHLYEHLYVDAIIRYFRDNHLFAYMDYDLSGMTAEGCFLFVDIKLYTPEAQQLAKQLATLTPKFDYDAINGALGEIVAEKRVALVGVGTIENDLTESLLKLHTQPWVNIDDFDVLDEKKTHRSLKALWLSSDKVRTRTFTLELILDNDYAQQHRQLWPLFEVLGTVLLDNIDGELTGLEYGHYGLDVKTTYTAKAVKRSQECRTWLRNNPVLTTEFEACKKAVTFMLEHNLVHRLADVLQRIDYETDKTAPGVRHLYVNTGVLIGSLGWHRLATEGNIQELLRHTILRLMYGREKRTVKLGSPYSVMAPRRSKHIKPL